MNLSALFIKRPVATTLLAIAVLISGLLAYMRLPVAPLPNVAFPVIAVQASMAGASPEIMAVLASVIGALAVVGGLFGSLKFDTPSGPSIVVAALGLFILSLLTKPRMGAVAASEGGRA